jgi:FAD binding domain/Berberine and berberine like
MRGHAGARTDPEETELTVTAPYIHAFAGTVLAPGDHGWDAARAAFNTEVDQRPAAIALPVDATDVAAAIRYARETGLRVAPQRTGHNAGPLGDLAGTLLLKTDALDGVEIDVEARHVRIGAGARWGQVVPRVSPHGLSGLHGSSPDVGITGYSLGGGQSWYGRRYGLQANSVTAIELVTADGELRRVDHDHEPELFWALRGGGGNFGVVTALEFGLHPVGDVYAGILFYPWQRSAEVFHAWHELLPGLPEELTTIARIMEFPPGEEMPEPLRAGKFAMVEGVWIGDRAGCDDLLRPLRALGPVLDTFEVTPPAGIAELHMDPREPLPALLESAFLEELPAKAIEDFVAACRPEPGSPLASVELGHMGGAMARTAPQHGARASFPGAYSMFAIGVPEDAGSAAAILHELGRVRDAAAAHEVGAYLNYVDVPSDPGRFFDPDTLARLRKVKAQYDPGNVIRANHEVV